MTHVPITRLQPEESTAAFVAMKRRRRRPWLVAIGLGLLALLLLVAVLAPTTTGLSQTLATVCTAAGPSVPADASNDCQQAQRGEIPVDAAGVPGLDGRTSDTAVTVPPASPGAPATVYPPGPAPRTLPAALGAGTGPVVLAQPPITVTVPTDDGRTLATPATVTVTGAPAPASTVPGAPITLRETETVRETVPGDPPPPVTETTTVTETVTVTAAPGPPPGEPAGPPPGEQSPVTTSGAPSPAPSPEQPGPVLVSPSPVAATTAAPVGQDRDVLVRLLGLGLVK